MNDFLLFSGENIQNNNFDYIIEQISLHKPNEVLFWCVMEYEPSSSILINEYLKLNNFCSNHNVIFYFMFASNDLFFYENDTRFNHSHIRILYWPTHLLHYTYNFLMNKFDTIGNVRNKFEKIFLNFNNRPHNHRCMTVDKLFESGLNNYGKISWNMLTKVYRNDDGYNFKNWSESIMNIDNFNYLMGEVTDDLLKTDTFMSLISESTHDTFFVTEKTFKSILIGQIFYCIGSKGQNLRLKEFGFKLYDEIFDYSYDMKNTIEERIDGVIFNIKNLIDKDLYHLHEKVSGIIEYNKNRALEIIERDPYMPKKFIEMFKANPNKFYESHILNNRLKYTLSRQLN
jgi:hypothetical protein